MPDTDATEYRAQQLGYIPCGEGAGHAGLAALVDKSSVLALHRDAYYYQLARQPPSLVVSALHLCAALQANHLVVRHWLHPLLTMNRRQRARDLLAQPVCQRLGRVHLCGGDAGAEFNVVRAVLIGWLDKPSAEIFLSAQVRFREWWSAKGGAQLRAQQQNAAPSSLLREASPPRCPRNSGADNHHNLHRHRGLCGI